MSYTYSQTYPATGALLEKDGKFLLVKENWAGAPDFGKWSHPAGWLEIGEDPIESVRREVKEETTFDFEPKEILGIYSIVRKDLKDKIGEIPHAVKIIYVGDFAEVEGAVLSDDVSEVQWFSPEEIYAMNNEVLRHSDIKKMVKDYLLGQRLPLTAVSHTISV